MTLVFEPTGARRRKEDTDRIVLEAMQDAARPVGAYEIVAETQRRGAPLMPTQVYRSLARMIVQSRVARIVTTKNYVPVSSMQDAICLCEGCGAVALFHGVLVSDILRRHAKHRRFTVSRIHMELLGVCARCDGGQGRGV